MQNMEKVNVTEYLDEFENIKAQIAILVKKQRGNYTQEAYASKIGITPKSLYNYETGKQLIRTDVVRKMFRSNPSLMREVMQLRKAASNSRGNAKRAGNKALKPVNVLNKVPIKDLCDGITTRIGLDKSHTLYEEWGVCSTMATKNFLRKDRNYLILAGQGQIICNTFPLKHIMSEYEVTEINSEYINDNDIKMDPFERRGAHEVNEFVAYLAEKWIEDTVTEQIIASGTKSNSRSDFEEAMVCYTIALLKYMKYTNDEHFNLERIFDDQFDYGGSYIEILDKFYSQVANDEDLLEGLQCFIDAKNYSGSIDNLNTIEDEVRMMLNQIRFVPSRGEGKDLIEKFVSTDNQILYIEFPNDNPKQYFINWIISDIINLQPKFNKPIEIMFMPGNTDLSIKNISALLSETQGSNISFSFFEMTKDSFSERLGTFAKNYCNIVTELDSVDRYKNIALIQQRGREPKIKEYKYKDLQTEAFGNGKYGWGDLNKEGMKNV